MKCNLWLTLILIIISVNVLGADSLDPAEEFNSEVSSEGYNLLFIGNSHSAADSLPDLVTTLIKADVPAKSAGSALAPGYRFLDERLDDGQTQQILSSRVWTHVILQAQKYSSSGLYYYSTDAAEEWIRRVKTQKARPILFPEWPRRGNTEEGPRIHQLHLSIAARESACVAPVGLAWEASIAQYPGLYLHASDGNHSNLMGSLLSAYVFYQVISGNSAAELPYVQSIKVSADIQQKLKNVASVVVQENKAGCTEIRISSRPGVPALDHWGLFALALSVAGIGFLTQRK